MNKIKSVILFCRENITTDILQGCLVVTLTLLAFIGLVWLREQIIHGGGPEWLDMDVANDPAAAVLGNGQPAAGGDQGEEQEAGDGPDLPNGEENVPQELPANVAAAGGGADNEDNANNDVNVGEDGQWNPMEWDRAADELTWERLLGLDGSLVFLEHVFWVVSLNTLFILVFGKSFKGFTYFSFVFGRYFSLSFYHHLFLIVSFNL